MNHFLFADGLRRNRPALLIIGLMAAAIWGLAPALFSASTAMGLCISLAQLAGPGLAIRSVAPREVMLMPVSRQEIWRTRFAFGTFTVASATIAGKLAATAVGQFFSFQLPGLDTLSLSTAYDLLAAFAVSLLLFVFSERLTFGAVVGVLVFVSGPFVPIFFANQIPATWSELGPAGAVVMGLGLLAGILAYTLTPRVIVPASPASIRAAQPGWRGFSPEFSRVTGLRRWYLRVWIGAIAVQTGAMLLMPPFFHLMNTMSGESQSWVEILREFGMLPFTQATQPSFIWIWILANISSEWVGGTLRQLRTLPLTTRRLNLVLLSTSFVTWTNAWIVLAVFHRAVTGQMPETLQIPLLAACIGLDTFFRALQIRWRNPIALFPGLMIALLPIAIAVRRWQVPVETAMLAGAPIAVAAAAWLNQNSLRNRREIYTPLPRRMPTGMELPGQTR